MSAAPPVLRTLRARWLRRFPRKALAALDAGQAVAFLDRRVHSRFSFMDRAFQVMLVAVFAGAAGVLPFPLDAGALVVVVLMGLAHVVALGRELHWWKSHRSQAAHDALLEHLEAAGVLTQRLLPARLHRTIVGRDWAAEMAYLLLHPEGQALLASRSLHAALPASPRPAPRSRL